MKDHEIRELVNTLTEIGKVYGETQQLRQRIHEAVIPKIQKMRGRIEFLEKASDQDATKDDKLFADYERESKTAHALEAAVCMYTHFTGEPPYVGDEGLVLAIKEAGREARKLHNIMDAHPEFKILLEAESKSQVRRLAKQMKKYHV